jgi:hypothetical protein
VLAGAERLCTLRVVALRIVLLASLALALLTLAAGCEDRLPAFADPPPYDAGDGGQ